ncbi:LysM peptidoglycan-binding domain-containing protein [Enterococcus faecium]|uniref:LysM peptidoglycan-binding domain-containing protein n=1 Tax=Enterococcus faecium TaxID=1352 RepID=UPI0019EE7396|nr:LysM domain-containing protein [Enterococcus faecium]EGP4915061.1 LysM peptidoglycan-binding domain-containing protein [Enterococcus faecium]EGP5169240.1 LysM peptidoglycan-binding domain-containing protein [Enterococcus faecium]EGP5559719.1 LysM peptidoglycan-binding domain-containing protein [Enterococcus faecium]EME3542081.1 LysM peptidoglycan-binding domain-containing protein [Enterococcus faecium]EME7205053.1 LysM peptidoglycan-binding domain-containing protein [Enterococcus faecium]
MKILKVLAIGITVGGVALATAHEKVDAAEWTPRTVEQIKADMNGNEYTIVWGDTLSAISQATNITVQKLADMNKIANVDLIYAGNKLVFDGFDGNVVSVQNSNGETIAQSVIENEDKVVENQPVGQPVQDTTSNNTTNSVTQSEATPSVDNTVADNTQTGGQTTGNAGVTTPSTPENNGGTTQTQTPTQPDNNQNGSNNGQTTPSEPSQPDNGGTITPEKPYPLNPYTGSGTMYESEEAAHEAADKYIAENGGSGSYTIYVEFWSDGTTKVYLELYPDK